MSLNKLFTGNIVDKDGNTLSNVLIKGFHKESGIWSTVYDTGSESQYNINLGDGGFKTQDSTAAIGDLILLRFETKEANPIDRQFVVYKFNLTNADVYLQDVQLMDCQPANVAGLWSLSSETDNGDTFAEGSLAVHIGRIRNVISTNTNFNDDYVWVYAGATMEHRSLLEGQIIFTDRLSVDEVRFDWTENNVYITEDEYRYHTISPAPGYQEVEVRVINQKGQITLDTLYIQIRYNAPVPSLRWSPDEPTISDTFVIFGDTVDIDSRVTNIAYMFDGELVLNSPLIDYQWVQSLGGTYVTEHVMESNVNWNDGFNTYSIPFSVTIEMSNLPPSFRLIDTVIGETEGNQVRYTPLDIVDPDGDNGAVEMKWMIEYKTPFDNVYKIVYDPGYPAIRNVSAKEWIYNINGDYRITCTIRDSFGLETALSVNNIFDYSASCTGSGKIKLNADSWQLISIPVENKTVESYFLKKVADFMKVYNPGYEAEDAIEVCNAYPGHLDRFLSFVPGFTNPVSEHNFSHVMSDGTSINEITGFWVKVKDYKEKTLNTDIIIEWDQQD